MHPIVPLVFVLFLLIGMVSANADDTATCNKRVGR